MELGFTEQIVDDDNLKFIVWSLICLITRVENKMSGGEEGVAESCHVDNHHQHIGDKIFNIVLHQTCQTTP